MAYSLDMQVLTGLALLAFWLYCLFDVITTPDEECRSLPKLLWLLVTLLFPGLGGVLWLLLGRPRSLEREAREAHPAGRDPRPQAPRGPDDDPEFLRDLDRRLRDDD
jgi:hypothetical protein